MLYKQSSPSTIWTPTEQHAGVRIPKNGLIRLRLPLALLTRLDIAAALRKPSSLLQTCQCCLQPLFVPVSAAPYGALIAL